MSILITGMEMPPSCVLCRMSEYHVTNPYCKITETKILRNRDRNNDCPLFPVPPHGRLIDADAFLALINDSTILSDFLKCIINSLIIGEPTIIPADLTEEGE